MSLVKRKRIPILLITLGAMCLIMTGLLTGHSEIILPTFGALMTGSWLVQDNLWHYHRLNLCISLVVSSVVGLLISLLASYLGTYFYCLGLYIGFLLVAGVLIAGRTQIYPCFGVMALPIILHTTSFWYPVSVSCLSGVLVLVQYFLEKSGIRQSLDEGEFPDLPEHRKERLLYYLRVSTGIVPALGAVFILSRYFSIDIHLLLQAPLFVSYGTFCNEHSFFVRHPVNTWLQLILASGIGTLAYTLGHGASDFLGIQADVLWVGLSAGLGVCTMLLLGKLFRKRFPPAISLVITPFVISGPLYLPVYIAIASAYVIFMTWCVRRHPSYKPKDLKYMI